MHRLHVISLVFLWSGLAGCAVIDPPANRVAGEFRLRAYPQADAQYLSLRADHSFTLRTLDRSGNGLDESAPPKVSILTGTWRLSHGEVVLTGVSGSSPSDLTPRYALVGPAGAEGLQPLLGAGYIPPYKFVRLHPGSAPSPRPET